MGPTATTTVGTRYLAPPPFCFVCRLLRTQFSSSSCVSSSLPFLRCFSLPNFASPLVCFAQGAWRVNKRACVGILLTLLEVLTPTTSVQTWPFQNRHRLRKLLVAKEKKKACARGFETTFWKRVSDLSSCSCSCTGSTAVVASLESSWRVVVFISVAVDVILQTFATLKVLWISLSVYLSLSLVSSCFWFCLVRFFSSSERLSPLKQISDH